MKYTKTTNAKLNARLLKELGIYNTFKIERRKYILRINQELKEYDWCVTNDGIIPEYMAFSTLLSTEFTWACTKNPLLWKKLYYAIPIQYKMSPATAILKNEALMNTLKNIVEYCKPE